MGFLVTSLPTSETTIFRLHDIYDIISRHLTEEKVIKQRNIYPVCGTKQAILNYTTSKIFWKELPSLVARGQHHPINQHPVSVKIEICIDFIS